MCNFLRLSDAFLFFSVFLNLISNSLSKFFMPFFLNKLFI